MNYAGIDVANKASAVCVVDHEDRVVRELEVASEAEALTAALSGLGASLLAPTGVPLRRMTQPE